MQLTGWRRCDHENLRGRPEYYITTEISTRRTEPTGFTEDPYCTLQCVCSSTVFDSLICSYILGNKRKEKEIIFFIHR